MTTRERGKALGAVHQPEVDDLSDSESLAPAVTRAAAILDILASMHGTPAGPSELARRLGLPKSSIANICAALADAGLIRRSGTAFALGRRLAELGGAYLATIDQVQMFHDACQDLASASDETVQLAVLDGVEVTYVARHDGRQPVRLVSAVGRRLAASCTATGKACLSMMTDQEVRERYRGSGPLQALTDRSHRTLQSLLDDLAEVRVRGYAIDDEETTEGVICYGLAVPVRRAGDSRYAASITILKARATEKRLAALVADLRLLVDELADPLQHRGEH